MKVLENLWALLFPQRESALLIAPLTSGDMDARYDPQETSAFTCLSSYHDPVIRACVHEIKFHNNEHGAFLLAALLKRYLRTHPDASIVPIPLSPTRYRERGYNQVARILDRAGVPYARAMLQRTRHTSPQSSLDRKDRLANLVGAFTVRANQRAHVTDKHLIVIDDVATTGATFSAARAALAPHRPASVTCVTIAH